MPPLGHRAQAVGGEVPDDLADLAFVGFDHHGASSTAARRSRAAPRPRCCCAAASPFPGRRPQVELLQREALRPRVGQERLDRLVQPLGFLQHDVHQLRLVGRQRQLLLEHLHRAGHRRQRIANLVRDAGRHLTDRRQALLQPRVLLEPLDVGDVLERVEIAARSVGQRQRRDAQAEIDRRAVGALIHDSRCACCGPAPGPATGWRQTPAAAAAHRPPARRSATRRRGR